MNEAFDLGDQFPDTAEGSATDGFLRNDVEPDFYLVEPGRIGRGKVNVVTGTCGQPPPDAGVLVSGIVIDDQVHVESGGDTGVQMPKKLDELLVAMTTLALTHHGSGDGVEGRKQCGRAVSQVVVRYPFDVTEPQGQHRLGALQRLNLALLIDTQYQGFVGWVQIQSDNIAHLFDEERIGGKLKMSGSMRLQAESPPDPMDGRFRQMGFGAQRAATPMRTVFR